MSTNHSTSDNHTTANHKSHLDELATSTRAIHVGNNPDNWTYSPLMPPVYLTTTYQTRDPGKSQYEYSRSENPTRNILQEKLATLESARYGLVFASGLATITTTTFLLRAGDHIICCDDVYGGTHRYFAKCASRMNIETTFVGSVAISDWTEAFRKDKTKLVWIETPTNPMMKVVDVENVVKAIKKLDPKCLVVVDNTFMSPILQSPLSMGADMVMHSVTKYINGHSDVIMGALVMNDYELYMQLKYLQNALGTTHPSPRDCADVSRSIMTLHIRIERQQHSAMKLAKWLETKENVEKVLYPGLKSHPQHILSAKQCNSNFGAMISFYVKHLSGNEATKVLQNVKIFGPAVSLGCVKSLIQIPSLMTHTAVPETERLKLGMTDNFIRLSIGLEDPEDLIRDLDQSIDKAYQVVKTVE